MPRPITMTVYLFAEDDDNTRKWNVAEWLDDSTVQGWEITEGHPEGCPGCARNDGMKSKPATCNHASDYAETVCLTCGAHWCGECDPAPSALCHYCHGRGYSTAEITPPQPGEEYGYA